MELLRALAVLAEPPAPELERLAAELELGPLPSGADHTELFAFQLVPYASVYLDASGHLGGEARDRITGLWRAIGLEPPDEIDHLTTLLAAYSGWAAAEREAASEAARRVWRHRSSALLGEHLLSWLGVYLTKVEENGPDFYRRWARLLAEALAAEAERLAVPVEPSQHHRASTPLGSPDEDADENADDLPSALLAPVRSGILLTRRDLAGAARELGLAGRIGERRYMLRAMLGQDPAGLRRWLAGHAERQLERYAEPGRPLAATLGVWAERAQATRDRLRSTHPFARGR